MSGHKLFQRSDRKGAEKSASLRKRMKRSRFMKYFMALTTGIATATGGSNINNLGGNHVMAGPGERRTGAEEEDVAYLRQRATEAATAFREYIITGDETRREHFLRIYNEEFRGAQMHETREFMQQFSTEMERVREDERIQPLLESYREDRRTAEPVVMTDFIDTVHNIRERLGRIAPSNSAVRSLMEQVRSSEGRAVRADTPVGRVRGLMEHGLDLETAVRRTLQRPGLEELNARYGEQLTRRLLERMPEEQSRIAVGHLREFILTGDTARRDAFRSIWEANTSERFTELFSQEFARRIFEETESGLYDVTHAYNRIMQGIDPAEFASLVTQTYNLATAGSRQDISRLVERFVQQVHGEEVSDEVARQMNAEVVNPLLDIVARGQAGRAITMMRRVMATGDQQASSEFQSILNGRFLGAPIEENNQFWNEFERLYTEEIRGNPTLTAIVRGFRRNIVPIALRDIYTELTRETPDRERLNTSYGRRLVELVSSNLDSLSWFIRPAAQIEREISRRAEYEDAVATRLSGMEIDNQGQALADVYSALVSERAVRRSTEGLDTLEENFEELSWLQGSPREVQRELSRRAQGRRGEEPDALAVALQSRYGENAGEVLSSAYSQLRSIRQRRAQLNEQHGEEFVGYISENIERLHWLVRPVEQIESGLGGRTSDATAARIREITEDYSYTPAQLVSALARARQAINRGGIARFDASDAYGTLFVRPVVSREAVTAPTVTPAGTESRRRVLESRGRSVARDIDNLESQLSYDILAPASALLSERLRRWRLVNARIRREARSTYDEATLDRLGQDQRDLQAAMLQPAELRRSVDLAFSMLHVAETGGDVTRVSGMPGTIEVDVDTRDLRTLLDWYRSLNEGKQDVVGEVVASVLRQADPEFYRFVGSLNQRGFFQAVSRTYAALEGRGATTRADVNQRYGEEFVSLVERQAPHLSFLGNPATSMEDLRQGENRLFAGILVRCYRALASPREGESRERMAELFGETFVSAVEQNQERLSSLAEAGAGLEAVRSLPEELRAALMEAYPEAYARTRTAMLRSYLRQDTPLFYSMGAIHAALRNAPGRGAGTREREDYQRRVRAINEAYGTELVELVRQNMDSLGFVRHVTASPDELENIPDDLRRQLFAAFERGPAASRAQFMENLQHVATTLPGVYARLSNALLFSNPTDELGRSFEEAVSIYRQEFGDNYYLFSLYINMQLFGNSLERLGRHYGATVPSYMLDEEIAPEDLVRFFNSEQGRQLIRAGRTTYENLIRETLQMREERDFDPTEGEFITNQQIENLQRHLSVMDALYMGMALERISGADSSFRSAAGHEMVNTLVVIAESDPYLVGPYLLQVLPAMLEVAQDERTLVAGMTSFRQLFTTRYSRGQRSLAYSNAINRRYFLEVFQRIGEQLPEITSTFDHSRLEDELRMVPEPRTDEGYMSPFLYRYRPGWWRYQEDQIPMMYGQQGQPLGLLPRPTAPRTPFMPVPGGFVLDSGAMGLFSNMYDQLRPPAERMFRRGVPARYRIGALGASTIIRRLNELFGQMPANFQDYWLSGAAEAGMFYAAEGQEGVRTEGEFEETEQAAGVGATGVLRGVTGGERAALRYTRAETETVREAEGEEAVRTGTSRDRLEYRAHAAGVPSPLTGPLPLPLLDLVPVNWREEGVGIHRLREEFNWERATSISEGEEVTTSERYGGLLDSYQRIASENQTDMLVFVAGEHVPQLLGRPDWNLSSDDLQEMGVGDPSSVDLSQLNEHLDDMNNASTEAQQQEARQQAEQMLESMGVTMNQVERQTREVEQEERGRLKSRLYFVTEEGNIYQLAYGAHTESQLLNYLYGGANTQHILGSTRFVGQEMMTGDSALHGFDGAAAGFTIPRGEEGDTVSSLMFGQLVRNLGSMEPRHAEQAVGLAVTNLLQDRDQRDIYAAFYRGSELTEVDEEDPTRITGTRIAHGSVDVMWRRMRVDPLEQSFEARAVGGYPATAGFRWRHEIPTSRFETYGYGAMFSMSEIDLLREYRVVEDEADNMYSNMQTYLVDLYGWNEDEARNAGWLIAGNYMYGNLENWVGEEEETERPSSHYATLLMMYWANRHGVLVGGQRIPGFTSMYERIEQAMRQIQRNPDQERQILTSLSESMRQSMDRDIWRFALGYGYDGESVRVYTVGGGQYFDEQSYGNLYGLFLFGRPTRAFADILGHAYRMSGLVVSEDAQGNPQVHQDSVRPWIDLYLGAGIVDWPSLDLMRYERTVTMPAEADVNDALRDVYTEMGSSSYNGQRLIHSYGPQLVEMVRERGADLAWMMRPEDQIAAELRTRVEEEEDPIARSLVAQLYADRMGDLSGDDYASSARMIRNIYGELRNPEPELARLRRQYSADAVDIVATHASDLGWILLSGDAMRSEFRRRAGQADSLEHRLASGITVQRAASESELTGEEIRLLFERNLTDVLAGATNAPSRHGLAADRYDVILGTHLREDEERHGTFYVLVSPVAERADARGSIIIGNEDDYDEWRRRDRYIGRGVSRVEVERAEEGYDVVFSGDRRLRAFTAERIIGGITLPLSSSEYDTYRPEGNWTVGGLVHLLQDHQNDWLMGALYGLRTYQEREWEQLTVTTSLRHQLTNTAEYTDQIFWYVFFNRATGRVVLGSNDVWENEDELRDVCSQLGGCEVSDLRRTTAGTGITWARADIVTGERLSLHFFFEGGAEQVRDYSEVQGGSEAGRTAIDWQNEFIFRAGLGFSYLRQPEHSVLGTEYSIGVTGARGRWPLIPGEVGRPEYLESWSEGISEAEMMGWWMMMYGRIRW
ncbi:hypothetical protein GF318_05890 [Candidatus Micrarchaeota archaeon]|nr:hypothetical protein [Candidatus Micrarchaeota archaeon]